MGGELGVGETMSDEERVFLTADEAIAMLPDRDVIHTFLGFIGADWDRQDVVDLINNAPENGIELAGGMAAALDHKIACFSEDRGRYIFIETKPSDIEGSMTRNITEEQ